MICSKSVNTVENKLGESDSKFGSFSIGTSPWDASCKRRRRAAATALNIPATRSYAHILDFETRAFVREVLQECRKRPSGIFLRPIVSTALLERQFAPDTLFRFTI